MCSDIEERVLSPSIPTEPETRCSVSGSCPRIAQRSWAFRRRSPADPAVRPALHLGAHAVPPARLRRHRRHPRKKCSCYTPSAMSSTETQTDKTVLVQIDKVVHGGKGLAH